MSIDQRLAAWVMNPPEYSRYYRLGLSGAGIQTDAYERADNLFANASKKYDLIILDAIVNSGEYPTPSEMANAAAKARSANSVLGFVYITLQTIKQAHTGINKFTPIIIASTHPESTLLENTSIGELFNKAGADAYIDMNNLRIPEFVSLVKQYVGKPSKSFYTASLFERAWHKYITQLQIKERFTRWKMRSKDTTSQ